MPSLFFWASSLAAVIALQLAGATAFADATTTAMSPTHLAVYKSPTCGCCVKWMEHMQSRGYSVAAYHPADLTRFKLEQDIGLRYQSCHTAISAGGYRFEGHVPAKFVSQFLANPPKGAIGLAVPGMPVGSPGMEMGTKFMPYQVLLLKADGSHEVFADILTATDQGASAGLSAR